MIRFSTEKPIYAQIVDLMQSRIIAGMYPPGTKLPSVRDLAVELGVNPNTVQRAFAALEQDAFVRCERTAGRFATNDVGFIAAAREALIYQKTQDFVSSVRHYGCSAEEIARVLRQCMDQQTGHYTDHHVEGIGEAT